MAGTLGELVVSITTDLTKFNAGLKQAEIDIRNTTGKINEYTNKVGLTMVTAGTAITGAFALMVKSAVDYGDQIYETSQRTGVAVETLSRLKYVAEQTESSFEAVAMGLKFLNRNIYEATSGNKEMNDNFKMLGITLKDEVTGQVLKADEVFMKIADKFSMITDSSAKTNLAMQIFGRSGEALIPILNLGSEGIQRLSDEASRLGVVLTSQNAKAIDQFSDDTKSLKTAIGGLWLEIANQLLPVLTSLVKQATEIVIKVKEWTSEHPALTRAIAGLGVALLGLGTGVLIANQLIKAMQTLAIVTTAMQLKNIFTVVGMGGLLTDIGTLVSLTGILFPVVVAIGTAFAGWKIGRVISEMTGLDEVLSGENGLFTKMFKWLYQNEEKARSILRIITAISTLGLSETTGLGKKISTPATAEAQEITGPLSINAAGSGETENMKAIGFTIDETIKKIERHNEEVKALNDQYVSGKISVEEYFTESAKLHNDGISLRQQELDVMQQVMDIIDLKSDKERQELQIAQEKAAMELEMTQQSVELEALSTDAMYQRLTVMDESIQKAREYYQVKAELANQDLMDQQTTLDSATSLLQTMQSMHKTLWGSVFDFMNMGIKTFSSSFSTAISSIILGTKSAKEAFSDFCKSMITAVVEFVVQYAVQAAISMALGWMINQAVGAIAGSMAEAWLPAAYLASVATFGGAVGAGTAALGVGAGAAEAILGGMSAIGKGINGYATGGIVGLNGPEVAVFGEREPELVTPFSKLGNLGNTYNISVSLEGAQISSELDLEDVSNKLGLEVKRSLRGV